MNRFLSFTLVLVLLSGCLEEFKDIDDIKYEPEVAFPVINDRVGLTDFSLRLDDFVFDAADDGTLELRFDTDVFDGMAEDYFSIPDQTSPIITVSGLNSGGVPLAGTLSAEGSDILTFTTENGERMDQLRLKGGNLRLVVNSTYTVGTQVEFDIPNLLINSVPFSQIMDIQPGNNTLDIPLDNAFFNLQLEGSSFNQLEFTIRLTLTGNGEIVNSLQAINANLQIQSPAFKEIRGEAPYREIDTQTGNKTFNFLSDNSVAQFSLEEPSLQIDVTNSFGVPFDIDVTSFQVTDKNNVTRSLTGNIVNQDQRIEAPSVAGESVTTSIVIDTDNSNINELMSFVPSAVDYAATALYQGGTGKIFILDQSMISVSASGILPLYGTLMDLAVTEEFDFDGSILNDLQEVGLRVKSENSFPLQVELRITFLDATGTELLTLLEDDPVLIEGAPVDQDGRSTAAVPKDVEIALTESDIAVLGAATTVRLELSLSTSEGGTVPVRILDIDELFIQMSVNGKLGS